MDNENENLTNKKEKRYQIIIIVLCILIFILGGYLCYDKFLSKSGDNQTELNNNQTDKGEEKNNNSNNSEETDEIFNNLNSNLIDNSANLDFDFNELSDTLHYAVLTDPITTTFVNKCKVIETPAEGPPVTEYTNTVVSSDSIDIIINKLKSAQSLEKDITYSWFGCPPRFVTYLVSVNSTEPNTFYRHREFMLNYASDNYDGDSNILLVNYKDTGYAFHFSSKDEIYKFIETLK